MEYAYVVLKKFQSFYNEMNSATLTGAIDVVVVEQPDGTYLSTPFHVRFGKYGVLHSREKIVDIEINGDGVDSLKMKLGENGEAFFVDDAETDGDDIPDYLATSPLPRDAHDTDRLIQDGIRLLRKASSKARRAEKQHPSSSSDGTSAAVAAEFSSHGGEASSGLSSDGRRSRSKSSDRPPYRRSRGRGARSTSSEEEDEESARLRLPATAATFAASAVGAGLAARRIKSLPHLEELDEDVKRQQRLSVFKKASQAVAASGGDEARVGEILAAANAVHPDQFHFDELVAPVPSASGGAATQHDSFGIGCAETDDDLVCDSGALSDSEVEAPRTARHSKTMKLVVNECTDSAVADWRWGELPDSTTPTNPPPPTTATVLGGATMDGKRDAVAEEGTPGGVTAAAGGGWSWFGWRGGSSSDASVSPPARDRQLSGDGVDAASGGGLTDAGLTSTTGPTSSSAASEGIYLEELEQSLDSKVKDRYLNIKKKPDVNNLASKGAEPLTTSTADFHSDSTTSSAPAAAVSTEDVTAAVTSDASSSAQLATDTTALSGADVTATSDATSGSDAEDEQQRTPLAEQPPSVDDVPQPPLEPPAASLPGVDDVGYCSNPSSIVPDEPGGRPGSPWSFDAHDLANEVAFSLCGGDSLDEACADEASFEEAFKAHRVSYDQYCDDPSILDKPDLVAKIGNRYYPRRVAFAMLMSNMCFQRPLSEETVSRLMAEHRQEQQHKAATAAAAPGGTDSAEAAGGIGSQQQHLPPQGGWFRWRRAHSPATPPPSGGVTTADGSGTMTEAVDGAARGARPPSPLLMVDRQSAEAALMEEAERDSAFLSTKRCKRSLRLTSDQLRSLGLYEGSNDCRFSVTTKFQGTSWCVCHIYLFKYSDKIVISDIDGTITKSDVLGHVVPMIGGQWAHTYVAQLFTTIKNNGYRIVYLSSRAIGQSHQTKAYLRSIEQDQEVLPDGPVLLSPTSLLSAFRKEVIEKKPEEFKMAALGDLKSLFPQNPFYAGFGNRPNDVIAYEASGLTKDRILIINPTGQLKRADNLGFTSSYKGLAMDCVDYLFPPLKQRTAKISSVSAYSGNSLEAPTTDATDDQYDSDDGGVSSFAHWKRSHDVSASAETTEDDQQLASYELKRKASVAEKKTRKSSAAGTGLDAQAKKK